MGGFRDEQRLAQAGVGQDKMVIHLEEGQLLSQARFALTQRIDPAPARRHALADVEVEPVTVDGGIAPSTSASSRVEGRRAGCRWRVSSSALSIAEWVHMSTMATFPAPATSNAACGFPALRFPVRFMSRVMGPILLGALSAVVGAPGSC